jgi:hypothetical protein
VLDKFFPSRLPTMLFKLIRCAHSLRALVGCVQRPLKIPFSVLTRDRNVLISRRKMSSELLEAFPQTTMAVADIQKFGGCL